MFDIISLFFAEFEKAEIGTSGKQLIDKLFENKFSFAKENSSCCFYLKAIW